jgi:hypothetical protein
MAPPTVGQNADMMMESRQIAVLIERPASEVYDYASDPANMPEWAAGLGSGIREVDGDWYIETTEGRVGIVLAPRNSFGVLDHWVTTPSGEVVYVPMRVFPNEDGSEVVFSLRRDPSISDADFERDADTVADDLARLKSLLESRG